MQEFLWLIGPMFVLGALAALALMMQWRVPLGVTLFYSIGLWLAIIRSVNLSARTESSVQFVADIVVLVIANCCALIIGLGATLILGSMLRRDPARKDKNHTPP